MVALSRSLATLWLATGLWLVGAAPLFGQVFQETFELSSAVRVDEPDSSTRTHVERIRALLAERQWDEAIETLRQVAETSGSKVIELADARFLSVSGFRQYVPLSDYCQAQLAALPAEGLALYRQRVDPLARRWYEEGLAQRDADRLSAVSRELLCSSWGDEALLALGDVALEQGRPAAARTYWQRLVERPWERIPTPIFDQIRGRGDLPPDKLALLNSWYVKPETSEVYQLRHNEPLSDEIAAELLAIGRSSGLPPSRLAYPGTSLDLADVRSRLILASIFCLELDRAGQELEEFRRLHGSARGKLSGKEGNYAEILGQLLAESHKWPGERGNSDWPTFGGNMLRNGQWPASLDIAGPAWPAISLGEPLVASVQHSYIFNTGRVAEDPRALLSFHPIVVGELILVATPTQVLAFNLKTGKAAWPGGANRPEGEILLEDSHISPGNRSGPGVGVPRFTLTAHGGRLYARVGSQVTVRPLESFDNRNGFLVCIDLAAQGKLVWKIKPDDEKWAFEGAPLAEGGDVYVAMRRSDVRPQAFVACFDAETGRRRWRTLVCAAESPGGGIEEMTHNLLTLHEGTLYCNTNLGAVAALSARDGRVQWITVYQRAERSDSNENARRADHFYRDLNPCVYHRGRLFVAPADCRQVFALDAASGQFLWDSPLVDAVHLLGVGRDHLIASGDRLYWINVHTGKVAWFPDNPGGSEATLGRGRGILAGGLVYWPTRDKLYVFDQTPPSEGGSGRAPIPLAGERGAAGGNLVVAGGYLLIASPNKLYGFALQTSPPPAQASTRP